MGDETVCERGYCRWSRERDRRPSPFWSFLPDREPGPDAEHCALAQRIVAFRREVEEHVKESQFLQASFARGERSQRDINIPPLRRDGCASEVNLGFALASAPRRNTFTTETAVFGTFTRDLKNMALWLRERRIRHVAMESTGVY